MSQQTEEIEPQSIPPAPDLPTHRTVQFLGSESGNAMLRVAHSRPGFAAIGVRAKNPSYFVNPDGTIRDNQHCSKLYQFDGRELFFVQFDSEEAMLEWETMMRETVKTHPFELRQLWPPVEDK